MLVRINDIELYYEKIGAGRPIILLHGNGESHKIFNVLTERLKDNFTVYAIDSRGHGQSTRVKKLDYQIMAEDIVRFINELHIEKPILYGFSDGGIIGLLIAYRHPYLLSKLIISGANVHPSGIKKLYFRIIQIFYLFTRNRNYERMLTQPDITEDQLKSIAVETLVLAGSKDMIDEKHTRHIAECIPESTLEILDGETHSSYVVHSHKLYHIMIKFINN